jgi:lysophospholipase L1-like esterase
MPSRGSLEARLAKERGFPLFAILRLSVLAEGASMTAAPRFRIIVTSLVALCAESSAVAATKVACVGDSITAGSGTSGPAAAYPSVLGTKLGAPYQVGNFGVSGATLLTGGDNPYVRSSPYPSSGAFLPDVVVIMLGTNDSKPQNWSQKAAFDGDYPCTGPMLTAFRRRIWRTASCPRCAP